ncbi:Mechanosensitive ion channel MscS [Macleaya cordata]|uniref:Mechanosensitive ion channel MscS n=1 Tax=Macleaya cordata TaxID=56857 RepID=A0A200Q8A8_MACCD|nr:Mechanosensitive ion channel MscS [Macleaya cordata]
MMAGVRISFLKSGFNHASQTYSSYMNFTKLTNRIPNQKYPKSVSRCLDVDSHFRVVPLQSSAFSHRCLQNNGLSNLSSWKTSFPLGMSSSYRAYSSFFGSRGDGEISAGSVANGSHVDGNNIVGTDWVDNLKNGLQSVVDASAYTGGKAKEAADELTPHIHQLLESHPYLKDVIIPVSGTLTGTLLAWVVMPRVLRKFHKYSMQGSAVLLSGNLPQEQVPYEKSVWGAVEDPIRYLASFMAFSYLAFLIAPTTITTQYMPEIWRGAAVVAVVWFLFRWKTNVFSRTLAAQGIAGLDRERWLALDKFSSVALIVLGLMGLAEACGVAVQSIVTVGGIGGVATAFAARDILGNVLSGLSMQFSKPFSLGDTIKAGSIEGQVVEMGLTTTSLLNAEKFPVIVPNSLFSSQVIVNKSRAQWRAMLTKVPLRIDNFEKIPQISEDIKSMLSSNAKIFLGKEAPYCFLSRIENSFAELTIGCNLIHMSKDELYSTQQDILLQAARIIKQHGAVLGSTSQDLAYQ